MSAWKEKGLFRFVVRVLVLVMALQAWPLWQLSHSYRWVPGRYLELFDRLGAFLAPQEVQAADAMPGDLDDDCDVDFNDLNIILAGRNTPAAGPDDPRDLDGDGVITVLDARKCVLLCTRPRCAVEAYTVNVPDLVGLERSAAVAELEAAELTVGTITQEEGDPGAAGTVIDQSRPAGAQVAPGCTIDLLVSPTAVENMPPVAEAGQEQSHMLALGQTEVVVTLDATASEDPDGEVVSCVWSGTPDPEDTMQPQVTLTAGTYAFTLVVTDDDGATSDPDTVEVTVSLMEDNAPPAIDPVENRVMDENATLTVGLSASDPEGDPLSLSVLGLPPFAGFQDNGDNTGTITFTPSFEDAGVYFMLAVASDGSRKASDDFTITVNNLNRPPTANAGGPYAGVLETALLFDGGLSTDPDGDPLTYLWSLGDGSDDASGVQPSHLYTQTGSYQVTLTVEDGHGGSDTDTASVTVIPPPVVDLQPVSLDTSGLAVDPQTLEISGTAIVEIRNNEADPVSGDYIVTVFEDTNTNRLFDVGTDTVFGTATVPYGPEGGASIPVPVAMNGNALFVQNLIYAFVDSENGIDETNEANNITHNMADCEFIPPVGSFDPVLEWAWTESDIRPDSYQVVCTPVVINLNDDNADGNVDENDIPDIVFNSYSYQNYRRYGILRAISGDGGGELFSIDDLAYRTVSSGTPAAGDIDGDGLPEIVAVHEVDYTVMAFENDGTFKWQSSAHISGNAGFDGSLGYPSAVISDIDEDGSPEIIVGRLVLNSDGTTKWSGAGGYGMHNSCVANLDLQGLPELVAGNTAYRADGEIYWQNASVREGWPAVGNFDDDPYPEIVVSGNEYVYLMEHTGEIIWGPITLPGGGYGGPATIADYDNDGAPEIGIAGYDNYTVFETDGSVKWQADVSDHSSNITGSSVFDFEGDGSAEVVYADEYYLRIYRGSDGFELFEYEVGSRTRIEYPVIADVDNDNNAEIIVATNNDFYHGPNHGIMVFGDANDTWVNTRKIWNQHAYSITNVNDDGTIPQHPANNWEIFNNFRQNQMLNPFGCNDLTASYVRVDDTNLPDSIDILARIGNGGALHVAPGVNVAFYEGDPASGGTLLGTVQTERRLYPGEYEEVHFAVAGPSSGMYEFCVVADDDGSGRGKVSEINEENNTAHTFFGLNFSPLITSLPVTWGAEGEPYVYDVEAEDPEDDALTYSMVASPEGMAIDPASGLITWTPGSAQAGDHSVEVQVDDGQGGFSRQSFVITVEDTLNTPPQITSSPPQTIYSVEDYSYPVTAVDPDGDTLSYELTTAPDGMTVSAGGVISWPESPSRPELAGVTVVVSDGRGGEDSQSWQISVVAVPPPEVHITVTPAPAVPGDTVTIQLDISSYLEVVERTVTVNGAAVPVVNDQAEYTTGIPGTYAVEATATSVQGATGTAFVTFRVVDPDDTEPPEISVLMPPGLTVEAPYEIIGTICDPWLVWYEIELAPQGSGQYRVIAEGDSCVEDGVLGVIDPTVLANGLYDLRITAYDAGGNVSRGLSSEPIEVSGRLKIGLFSLAFEDITIPVSGIPITVTRTYNSFDKQKGDFGVGWDMFLGSGVKVQVTRPLGYNWFADYDYCFQWFYGQCMAWVYKLETSNIPKVLVTYADGRQDRFEFTPVFSTEPALDPEWMTAAFTPLEGTTASLEVVGMDDLVLLGGLSGNTLYDLDLEPFDPDLFRLTTAEGMVLVLSRNQGLRSMTDPNGNTLTFGPGGMTHSAGLSINMERDSEGRVTRITDPMGYEVGYDYDGNGDLIEFTDQEGNLTQYGYDDNHNLVSIIDPRGIEVLETEYDALGRMIGTTDALGNSATFVHDTDNAVEYVTDRLGYTTAYEYDSDGNVISITDPLGNITTFAYDDRGNPLRKTDALGNTTTWTYDDRDNKLTETDPLGNTTTWTYNDRNRILTKTDPLANVTTYTYDTKGNQLTKTNALGNTTAYAYDGSGHLTSMTDCESNVTSYAYDTYGNKESETDALGYVTTYAYDSNGNLLAMTDALGNTTTHAYDNLGNAIMTTDPLGNVSTTEYNEIGKKSAETDKNGNRTEYGYDKNGKLVQTTHPDGTVEAKAYDANGNRISSTDRAARITQYEYDPSGYGDPEQGTQGRLAGIVYADGSTNRYEYDDAGRMSATVDENGNRTEYGYDAAGRRIRITDALGNVTTFSYDTIGNQISMTDGNGNVTSYVYDALNRRVQTVFADGTSTMQEYAANCCSSCSDKKIAEIDQAGITTLFDYDALGRLVRVTDAVGGETRYAYDAVGNRLTQTDANGNTTSFTFDKLKRVLTRTLPMGQTEQFVYDAVGNVVAKTDFNGDTVTYTYDTMNQLTRKQYPDTSEISFTYTPTGKRATDTDARGVTAYTHDVRDRLLEVENPDGTTISYAYDVRGNRTSVTVPSGTTTYAYDALNRLEGVVDPDGGLTDYEYDNVGNRTSIVYPNGTVAEYVYNRLNRLVYVENRKSAGEILSSHAYTLAPAGNRVRVVEHTGRIVDYTYDSLYRLTEEDITDPALGDETIGYTYDAVGNRLTRTDGVGTTTYTYNANDQLLTEVSPLYSRSYGYDNNGNTISRTTGSDTDLYDYDYNNRLVDAQTAADTLSYRYDVNGNRVQATVNGDTTNHLVDGNRRFAQVLEERDGAGVLIADYVHGDDLIRQRRGAVLNYYHYDGQMSTRVLTDPSEAATDSYVYDAFGNLLHTTGTTENTYLYTGEQYDPNVGFYYLRARYYDQGTGRFMTHDPFLGNHFDPPTLHRYMYANANPVMYRDPSGQFTLAEATCLLAIEGSLIAFVGTVFGAALARVKEYEARTDKFIFKPTWGVDFGIGAYGGTLVADIEEKDPEQTVLKEKYKTTYTIIFAGVGNAGVSLDFYFTDTDFSTETRASSRDFSGLGVYALLGYSIGRGSLAGSILLLPGQGAVIGVGPTVGFSLPGMSAFYATAIWIIIDGPTEVD